MNTPMNEHSDPIEFIIDFAWASGANIFVINNAKDELKKLKETKNYLSKLLNNPVAYGKINNNYDLYDLRLTNNPYDDQTNIVPLYSNRKELLSE